MSPRSALLALVLAAPLAAQESKSPTLADLQRSFDEEAEKAVRTVNERRLAAIDEWLKANPKGDDRGPAMLTAAGVASGLQKHAESAAYAQKYLEEFASGAERQEAGRLAGLGLLYSGNEDEAKKVFEKTLEGAKPSDGLVEVIEQLGALQLKAGRKYEALKTYEKLEEVFGKQAAGYVKSLKDSAEKIGTAPPPLEAKDLEGKDANWDRFKGKLVLVDFWATWCGPCVQEFPNVLAAYRKYHDRGFEVLGISLDRERESLDKFIKEKSAPWTQVYDNEGKIAEKWGVQSIPATFLISPEGKIVRMNLRGPSLDRAVSQNLPKK